MININKSNPPVGVLMQANGKVTASTSRGNVKRTLREGDVVFKKDIVQNNSRFPSVILLADGSFIMLSNSAPFSFACFVSKETFQPKSPVDVIQKAFVYGKNAWRISAALLSGKLTETLGF